jgi:hypothetical protein
LVFAPRGVPLVFHSVDPVQSGLMALIGRMAPLCTAYNNRSPKASVSIAYVLVAAGDSRATPFFSFGLLRVYADPYTEVWEVSAHRISI